MFNPTSKERNPVHMQNNSLGNRITLNPSVCGGKPCIRDTRIEIAIILDGMAEGLSVNEIFDHYPQLSEDDIHAALSYAAELAHEGIWKTAVV